jgi:AraC-like DNA-binding protein
MIERQPTMAADTLSDLLRTVRLTGAVFFDIQAAAPWAMLQPTGPVIADSVLPGVQHLISYHAVTAGRCHVGLLDDEMVEFETGDVIVFPHGDSHVLKSALDVPAKVDLSHYRQPATQLPIRVRVAGDENDAVHLVCGFLGCDARPFNPLIGSLPRMLHVRARAGGEWLAQLVRVASAESQNRRDGGECVLSRLSEVLFVESIRRHLAALPAERTGWLAGLRDPQIGSVLALLHARPGFRWTLQDLATQSGMSRSVLAERFVHLIGQPPMQYLTSWRMQVAAGALARGDKIARVAFDVGYDSEAAFSRAFKRLVGVSPAAWRAAGVPERVAARAVSG